MSMKLFRTSLLMVMIAACVMFAASYAGAVTLGPELVTNGDMELGNPPTGWSIAPKTTVTADLTTFHSGLQSMKIVNNDAPASPGALAYRTVNLTAGKTYQIDFWYKNDAENRLYYRIDPTNGTGAGPGDMMSADNWTHYNYEFTMEAGTATAYRLAFYAFNAKSTVWVDDVSIKEVLPAK